MYLQTEGDEKLSECIMVTSSYQNHRNHIKWHYLRQKAIEIMKTITTCIQVQCETPCSKKEQIYNFESN